MVLCSICDAGWHTACMQPPLAAVPAGDWLCPQCAAAAAASGGEGSTSSEAPVRITVAGQPVAWVQSFKYLGSLFAADGSLGPELERRAQLANAVFWRLSQQLWRPRSVALSTKMSAYRALVAAVLLYGAHAWTPTAPQLETLERLQRRHLRHILGRRAWQVPPGSADGAAPRHISNQSLLRACGQANIEAQLGQCRMRWLGHTLRMDSTRLPKQLLLGRLDSTAPRQPGMPPTLCALYQKDVTARIPRNHLRSFPHPPLTPPPTEPFGRRTAA